MLLQVMTDLKDGINEQIAERVLSILTNEDVFKKVVTRDKIEDFSQLLRDVQSRSWSFELQEGCKRVLVLCEQ